MFGKIKSFTISLIAGANVVAVIVMILVGFADHVNPVNHATFSSLGMLFPLAALVNLAFLFFWLIVKWRLAWIPFVGFLLVYVPMRTYMPLNLPLSLRGRIQGLPVAPPRRAREELLRRHLHSHHARAGLCEEPARMGRQDPDRHGRQSGRRAGARGGGTG